MTDPLSRDFFLGLAGVSATLLGTFIVGVFFYLDSDMHRRISGSTASDAYFRSGLRWVFSAYSMPLFVSLTLSSAEYPWVSSLAFAVLSATLLVATIDTLRRLLAIPRSQRASSLFWNEWFTAVAIPVAIAAPWAIGGWAPSASAFAPSLLLVLFSGFTSTAALIMAEFDHTMGTARSLDASPSDAVRAAACSAHTSCSCTDEPRRTRRRAFGRRSPS